MFLFDSLLTRRIAREPVAYITGHKEFWSLDFDVGPGALIPRPDTETLIEQAARAFPRPCGAARHSRSRHRHRMPSRRRAARVSQRARCRRRQLRRGARVGTAQCREAWAGRPRAPARGRFPQVSGVYDVILSNPPYIPSTDIAGLEPEVRLHEPHAALDGGPDGLEAYRALGPILRRLLKPGGLALLEIGIGQGEAVSRLLEGLEIIGIMPDLAGISRRRDRAKI